MNEAFLVVIYPPPAPTSPLPPAPSARAWTFLLSVGLRGGLLDLSYVCFSFPRFWGFEC